MIRLVQEFGAHTGRQHSFAQPPVRLGRAPTNEVAFDPNADLDSSGVHCELVLEGGAWHVVDLNSRNGTWVNSVRVQRQRLSHNDVIECGRGGPRLRVELQSQQPLVGTAPTAAIPSGAAPQGFPSGGFGAQPFGASHPSQPPPAQRPFAAGTPPAGTGFAAPKPMPPGPQNPPAFAPFGAQPSSPASPFGAPGAGASGPFQPQAPIATAPPGFAPKPAPGPAGLSAGAAVAANLPANAQVGKRTVAMLIDQALVQAGVKKSSGTGLKLLLGVTLLLVVAGLGIGGWFIWDQKQETDERLAQVGQGGGGEASAGQRITRANESAIYMLAAVTPGAMPQGFCTGFAVTQDLIATNAHCIDVANEMITQRGRGIVALRNNGRGVQIPMQPVFRDARFHNTAMGIEGSGYDVGVMRAMQPLPSQVRLATYEQSTQLTPGAQIYVYGFPGLTMNEVSPVATITEGILNRMTDFFDRAADDPSQAQKIQHSAQTTSGSSGSPIFLASGEVIGINAGSLSDAEHQSMVDPQTGRRVSVEVSRSSNFKYGMRADLIRAAVQAVGENAP